MSMMVIYGTIISGRRFIYVKYATEFIIVVVKNWNMHIKGLWWPIGALLTWELEFSREHSLEGIRQTSHFRGSGNICPVLTV